MTGSADIDFAALLAWAMLAGLLAAALSDIARMRIPNTLSLGLAGIGFAWAAATGGIVAVACAFLAAALLFGCGLLAFQRGWMGGGDVKLIGACGAFAGTAGLLDFMIATALAGGVVTLVWVLGAPLRRALAGSVLTLDVALSDRVPYGVAIAAGGLFLVQCRLGF